jgi:hypothetical protein
MNTLEFIAHSATVACVIAVILLIIVMNDDNGNGPRPA